MSYSLSFVGFNGLLRLRNNIFQGTTRRSNPAQVENFLMTEVDNILTNNNKLQSNKKLLYQSFHSFVKIVA